MKITDLIAFAKAGYSPTQVKQIKEYTTTVDNPADVLAFVKAGWKPDDIKDLMTEQPKQEDKPKQEEDPLETLRTILDGGNA